MVRPHQNKAVTNQLPSLIDFSGTGQGAGRGSIGHAPADQLWDRSVLNAGSMDGKADGVTGFDGNAATVDDANACLMGAAIDIAHVNGA